MPISAHSTLHWIGFTHEGLFATYDSQCVIRVFTGTEVPTEPIGVEEMEWVVLMNLKHIMKERCAAGEASKWFMISIISSSLLLVGSSFNQIHQVCLSSICCCTCSYSPTTYDFSYGSGCTFMRIPVVFFTYV